MFDIGWDEMLLTALVAIVVIGPKDLPRALRVAGQWMAKIRRVSGHFRAGIETMIREAELEEMEKQWRAQNEAIMREHPRADSAGATAESALIGQDPGLTPPAPAALPAPEAPAPEPELPLPPGRSA